LRLLHDFRGDLAVVAEPEDLIHQNRD